MTWKDLTKRLPAGLVGAGAGVVALVVVCRVEAQAPRKIDWYSVETAKRALLFNPGEDASVTVAIKPGAGASLRWHVVDQSGKTIAASAKPIALSRNAPTRFTWVHLSGALLFEHYPNSIAGWDRSFTVDVTGKLKPDRPNVLAVRVLNRAAAGGIFGKVALVTPTDKTKPERPMWW